MKKKIIVDIGCFNGRTLSVANRRLHLKKEKWFGLMVEPNKHLEREIRKSLQGTDFKYVNCAISTKDGWGKLYMGKYGFTNRRSPANKDLCMRSSLLKNEEHIAQHLTDNYLDVKLRTLDSLLAEHEITYVQILKIDTEGHDYDILNSYKWSVYPDKIMTEDVVLTRGKRTKLYLKEQNKIKELKYQLLESKGYVLEEVETHKTEEALVDINSTWVRG